MAVSAGSILAIAATVGSAVVGIGQVIITGDWTILKNSKKIIDGLFAGSPKQIWSRFTTELPQTITGYLFSQTTNMFGKVKSVSYYDGATVVQHYSKETSAFTIGSYINGPRDIKADPNNHFFQHEYGHYLQSQKFGWTYLADFAIPSGIDCSKNEYDGDKHAAYYIEQDANLRGRAYFGEDVWKYEENPIFGSGHNYLFDRDYSKYRTHEGLIRTSLWKSAFIMFLGW
ncbi:MAG: hypothetical protein PHS30_00920 [Bacteroidales bacterium]|nr:hypothetical protein [Bacteroidales bacterium]